MKSLSWRSVNHDRTFANIFRVNTYGGDNINVGGKKYYRDEVTL